MALGSRMARWRRELARARLWLARRAVVDPPAAQPPAFWDLLWREAAAAVGAEVIPLGSGFLELRRAGARTRVQGMRVALDDSIALRLAGDKPLCQRLLREAGLPVPRAARFWLHAQQPARALLREIGAPCVVKPARGTGGGAGVTLGVDSPRALERAALAASLHANELWIEEQVAGDAYRLLFLDGRLLDAVRRSPAAVTGDGRQRVRALIERENARRAARGAAGTTGWLSLGADCRAALARAGHSLRSVPAPGERVAVSGVSNSGSERESESVRGEIGKDLCAEAGRAAEVLGIRLAGVDVITRDPGVSLFASGGCIAEVNTTPGLHWHYLIRNPESGARVAIPILETLLGEARPETR
jgi:cyanophycin synthetase